MRLIIEAEAEAEAIALKGEAEAFAIEAKAKAEAEPLLKRLKRSSKAVKQVEKRQRKKAKTLEECSDSPWLHKKVRVVCEGLREGRVGLVKTVHLCLGPSQPSTNFKPRTTASELQASSRRARPK